jgi:16S rRNA (guanine966-N2)-methyltransferase
VRISGGTLKGRNIDVPKGLPVRPTTAFAGEALFNILNNFLNYEDAHILDLFSGTGHISLEFASRGCKQVTAVDAHHKCVFFLKKTSDIYQLPISCVKGDVFKFLGNENQQYDLIFADPPYDLPNIEDIHRLVFEKQLLNENGVLIIEHGPKTKMGHLPHFYQHRKYGNVNFSFFKLNFNQ